MGNYTKGDNPYRGGFVLNYPEGDYSLERTLSEYPQSSNDRLHTVLEGETLQSIAFRYYGDSGKWYIIADSNDIINPINEIQGDQILRIPMDGNS